MKPFRFLICMQLLVVAYFISSIHSTPFPLGEEGDGPADPAPALAGDGGGAPAPVVDAEYVEPYAYDYPFEKYFIPSEEPAAPAGGAGGGDEAWIPPRILPKPKKELKEGEFSLDSFLRNLNANYYNEGAAPVGPTTPVDAEGNMSPADFTTYSGCLYWSDKTNRWEPAGQIPLPKELATVTAAPKGVIPDPPAQAWIDAGLTRPADPVILYTANPQYNKYKLVQFFGSGQFGLVFLAWDGKEFSVLKLVKNQADEDGFTKYNARLRFITEFSIQYKLGIEGLTPQVYAVMMDDPEFYIAVTQVATGGSLTSYIAKNALNEFQKKEIVYQLAQKLHYMHKWNVAHRDIKPDNFLYDTKTKTALIGDFGEATLVNNKVHQVCHRGDLRTLAPELADRPYAMWPHDQKKMDAFSFGRVIVYIYLKVYYGGHDAGTVTWKRVKITHGGKVSLHRFPKRGPLKNEAWMKKLPKEVRGPVAGLLDPNWRTRWTIADLLKSDYLKGMLKKTVHTARKANKTHKKQVKAVKQANRAARLEIVAHKARAKAQAKAPRAPAIAPAV